MTTAEDPRIAELLDAIATTAPGHTTTWTNSGIEVTVYGQRRYGYVNSSRTHQGSPVRTHLH